MLEHTTEAKRLYKSAAWRRCRTSYIQSVFGLCERCEMPGLIVHHKIYINSSNVNNPSVTLNHDNLEYLCQTCHNNEHFGKVAVVREGLSFDSDGNLVESGSPPM
ncbi:HNH endonuclease [Sporosarcina sp. ANT_H38]|uniref:HNH endonuclease n=1 Tax=Sporosarcina sp. ANT_H38 TaxID=2597358 RepID=UPI0011F3AE66|nr:HNH endonuclease [Sporosarcina sp. ANT_H38]KAA0944163.1 HNH endonuclease [Sporosarcina sp. ANT_H38]